jgi:hypothetical protein
MERATGIEPAFSAWEAEDLSSNIDLTFLVNNHF